jgi:hypothetical protein
MESAIHSGWRNQSGYDLLPFFEDVGLPNDW